MAHVLDGIRVLDLTVSIAGPFTTMLLADCGAEVIRIESRRHLGLRRRAPWGPAGARQIPMAPEKMIDFSKVDMNLLVSPIFSLCNHDKMSVALNMSKPEGRELFEKMVEISDVVIDNQRFGVMQEWGFDYEGLSRIKGDIIVVSVPALGEGPHQNWVTWGMNLLSLSGFTHQWRHPGSEVTEAAASGYHGDFIAGAKTAAAIMAALYHRAGSGVGQFIEVSQAESTASVLGVSYLDYFVNNRTPKARGNRHPQFAPYNCYRCGGEDNWCVIVVRSEDEWQRFCRAIGHPAWTKDTKFADMGGRLKHSDELDKNIEGWTMKHSPHQVMKILQSSGVAAGAVQNGEHLYYDLQMRDRDFMLDLDIPRLGKITFPGAPLRLSKGQIEEHTNAPVLGEHNDYVYRQLLRLSEQEITKLADTGVIF